jgi:AAA+ superfamily predicted ATPase
VSSLLLQIDALPSYVVVVTASNHPELLDRAVWRRFQLRLELPMPNSRPNRGMVQAFRSADSSNHFGIFAPQY